MDDLKKYIETIGQNALKASYELSTLDQNKKNELLNQIADALVKQTSVIIEKNALDLENAANKGLSLAMCDRLRLDEKRIEQMAEGVRNVVCLNDPVGEIIRQWERPNGMKIQKIRVSIGVIAMIYESRPNVTVDASSLCLKSGNVVILKGGSEAYHSNLVLCQIIQECIKAQNLNPHYVQFIESKDRAAVDHLLKMDQYIHVVIPRGGPTLIRKVAESSTIPVIKHYDGICHVYIDQFANLEMAKKIAINAKVQRPGVCNALETLLVHQSLSETFLPELIEEFRKNGVVVRGDDSVLKVSSDVEKATEDDWKSEYLDLILSIRVVDDIGCAIDHIREYGSAHTDTIVTDNSDEANKFLSSVDSSTVLHNVSTRFSDGFEFGFGAEMGISTDKLHARGPVGLEELTTYKYIVRGEGQVRE